MASYRVIFARPEDPPNYWYLDFREFIATTPGLERVHAVLDVDYIEMEFRDEETFALFMLMFPQDEFGIYLTPLAYHYFKG